MSSCRSNGRRDRRDHSGSDLSVIICAYTDRRWDQLKLGYEVAADQLRTDDQLIIVIDHNENLEQRARAEFTRALVVANAETRGLSGARNTGVSHATADVVVFLDDDACPEPGWLDAYRESFVNPDVQVVSGAVEPSGPAAPGTGVVPRRVRLGRGLRLPWSSGRSATDPQPDRRQHGHPSRSLSNGVGGFATEVGRVGHAARRLRGRPTLEHPDHARQSPIAQDRSPHHHRMLVRHSVSATARRVRYFLSRCFHPRAARRSWSPVGSVRRTVWSASAPTSRPPCPPESCAVPGRPSPAGFPVRSGSLAIATGLGATATGFLSARVHSHQRPSPHRPSWTGRIYNGESAGQPGRPLGLAPAGPVEYRLRWSPTDQVTPTPGTRIRLLVTSAGRRSVSSTSIPPSPSRPPPRWLCAPGSSTSRRRSSGRDVRAADDLPRRSAWSSRPVAARSNCPVACDRCWPSTTRTRPHRRRQQRPPDCGRGTARPAPHDPRLRIVHEARRGASVAQEPRDRARLAG